MARTTSFAALGLSLLLGTSAYAQLLPPDPPSRDPHAGHNHGSANGSLPAGDGKLSVMTPNFDFGQILDTQVQNFSIKLGNEGPGDLLINRVQPSCGCTTSEPWKPRTLAPGEEVEVPLAFNPRNKHGKVTQNVKIHSNDAASPTSVITFKADVMQVVSIEPQIIQFGQIEKGSNASRTFKVIGRIPEFDVPHVSGADRYLSITKSEPKAIEIKGEQLYQVDVTLKLKDKLPIGVFRETLTLRTNDERRPLVSVQVHGESLGDLRVSPSRLPMGLVKAAGQFEREIKVTSASGKPFSITSITVADPKAFDADLSFDGRPEIGSRHIAFKIRVRGKAPDKNGFLKSELLIETDLPDEKVISVPIYATVRQ